MLITLEEPADGRENHVLFDRRSALDIAAFVVDGVDLSPGAAIPSDGDIRIDRALAGFLFTCGPEHIRHPEAIEGGVEGARYPLHGSLAGTAVSRTEMASDGAECTAMIEVALADGGQALVERRWRIDAGRNEVVLEDRIVNVGTSAFPPMMMYHVNIAGRLLGPQARIVSASLEGGRAPGASAMARALISACRRPFVPMAGRTPPLRVSPGSAGEISRCGSGPIRCRFCRCGAASAAERTLSASSPCRTASPSVRSLRRPEN